MIESPDNMSPSLYHTVANLSLGQTAFISGSGSAVSTASALVAVPPDLTWLQIFTVTAGATGAILSLGLVVLKFIQEWREMNTRRLENVAWQTASTLGRTNILARLDRLEARK